MMGSFVHRGTADVVHDRRACAKPDLPPGRAFCNDRRALDICRSWLEGWNKLDRLPRSGLAQAAFGGDFGHA